MTDSDDSPAAPGDVPASIVDELDSLDAATLRAVREYVDRRLEAERDPLAAAIEADTEGEVVDTEDQGAYALVRQHPPAADGSGVNRDVLSLYHVRREPTLDGEERLHWAHIGDVWEDSDAAQRPCPDCGEPVVDERTACPHCGRELSDTSNGSQ